MLPRAVQGRGVDAGTGRGIRVHVSGRGGAPGTNIPEGGFATTTAGVVRHEGKLDGDNEATSIHRKAVKKEGTLGGRGFLAVPIPERFYSITTTTTLTTVIRRPYKEIGARQGRHDKVTVRNS